MLCIRIIIFPDPDRYPWPAIRIQDRIWPVWRVFRIRDTVFWPPDPGGGNNLDSGWTSRIIFFRELRNNLVDKKYLKSLMRNRIRDFFDPGSKMEKLGSEFRDCIWQKIYQLFTGPNCRVGSGSASKRKVGSGSASKRKFGSGSASERCQSAEMSP